MPFSSRASWDLSPNPLAEALAERRASGLPVVDLTESNPTAVGLAYPEAEILAALADARSLRYEPDPAGLPEAREAIARYYRDRGVPVDPSAVLLTASTSEAYAAAFKLLCDPGDRVLVPEPSYPLFGFLAGLEGVEVAPYPLRLEEEWRLDLAAVRGAAAAGSTRAVVVVSPNNPTGSCLSRTELAALVDVARTRDLALVCDEVFADYAFTDDPERIVSTAAEQGVLTLTLSGLSKVAALPQLKLGWIVVSGPAETVRAARERIEVILDTYLSVNTPVQHAAGRLLDLRHPIQRALRERVAANRDRLVRAFGRRVLHADAGWYAVIEIPGRREQELVVDLVRGHGVHVHPGYLFDFPRETFVVVSLIVRPETLDAALPALAGA